MKKTNSKIYRVELLLAVILIICTLFHLTAKRYITASIMSLAAVLVYFLIKRKKIKQTNHKKATIIVLIFAILYVALFYTMGIYTGFYKSTVIFGWKSLVNYVIPITIIIFTTEYVRNKLLVDESQKSLLLVFLIGTIVDVSIYRSIYNLEYLDSFLAFIGLIIFASIANNLLYNYISRNYGAKPVIIFKCITILYVYIIPIVPNVYAYLRTFLRMLYPMIVYMYLEKYYYKEKEKEMPVEEKKKIFSLLGTSAIILVLIGLISCKFLYGVLVIGSNSMKNTLEKGDVVFFKQTKKIEEGDVIVFLNDNIRVVHRVVSVKNINDKNRYYTKGDANKLQDEEYVTDEQLMGKVLFKIKYIGIPTVWLNETFR